MPERLPDIIRFDEFDEITKGHIILDENDDEIVFATKVDGGYVVSNFEKIRIDEWRCCSSYYISNDCVDELYCDLRA